MPPTDPLKHLQAAARLACAHCAQQPAQRVVVFGLDGRKVLDVAVPPGAAESAADPEPVAPPAGWDVSERAARFEGKPVRVGSRRLPLLKALVEAEGPLTAKELTALAFDRVTDLPNTRYHIGELRKELRAFFGSEDEVIVGGDEGYTLAIR